MWKVNTKIQEIKEYNLINEAKFWYQMMWTFWTRSQATHTQRPQIPKKPSKSCLIGVWHKDNLYLGTNTIEMETLTQRIA
jgi:hypothetical protein